MRKMHENIMQADNLCEFIDFYVNSRESIENDA